MSLLKLCKDIFDESIELKTDSSKSIDLENTIELKTDLENTIELIKEIIKNDPDQLHKVDDNDSTPLILACEYFTSLDIVEVLIKKGSDVNRYNKNNMSALDYAIHDGNVELARLLISYDLDVNQIDSDGMGYLEYATIDYCEEKREIIQMLIDKDIDINIKCDNRNTILMKHIYSVDLGETIYVDVIKLFLENGCDPTIVNKDGNNVLDIILNVELDVEQVIESSDEQNGESSDEQKEDMIILIIKHMLDYTSVMECIKVLFRNKCRLDKKHTEELDELFRDKYIMDYISSKQKSASFIKK